MYFAMESGAWSFYGIELPSRRRGKLPRILRLLYTVSQLACMKEVVFEFTTAPSGAVRILFTTNNILNRGWMIEADEFMRYRFKVGGGLTQYPFRAIRDVLCGYYPFVSHGGFVTLSDFENVLSSSQRLSFCNDFPSLYRRMTDNL
jgi:hypothetical protein